MAIVDVGSGVSVAVFDSFLLMADLSSSFRPRLLYSTSGETLRLLFGIVFDGSGRA